MKNTAQYLMDANLDVNTHVTQAKGLTAFSPLKTMNPKTGGMRLNYTDGTHYYLPTLDTPFIGDDAQIDAFVGALDTDTVGFDIPSNGALQAATSIFTNMMITQLFQTTPFAQITQSFQNGVFGNSQIFVPQMTGRGVSQIYGGYSVSGSTNVNVNWMERDVVYLQRSMSYEDLAVAQMGLAKVNLVGGLRNFNSELIAIDINNIGFNGYEGYRTFGILNDPSLNPTIVSPNGVSGSSLWATKSYLEICADIQATITEVTGRAGGQAQYTDKFYFVIPPVCGPALMAQNALGTQTVEGYIRSVLPKVEIIIAQNVQGTGTPFGSEAPNYLLLVWEKMGGQPVALNAFVTPYYSHGVYRLEDYYGEKVSFAVAGCYVTRAMGIQLMSGI